MLPPKTKLTPEQARLAVERLKQRAAKAAVDPAAFLGFVFRVEGTNERLKVVPHQRVMVHFAKAHSKAVVRGFPSCGKTYALAALFTQALGQKPDNRYSIVSAAQSQAKKPLSLCADVIANEGGQYPELRAVFPKLRRSALRKDAWTQSAITVARNPGIRDPSIVANGLGGRLLGARLNGVAIDDVLNDENTSTPEQREKVNHAVLNKLVTRRGVDELWITVWNVPWDDGSEGGPPDLTYALEQTGVWATITLPINGAIRISNTNWTSDDLRPSETTPGTWRLTAHDSQAYGAPLCEVLPDGKHRRVDEHTPAGATVEYFDLDDEVFLWPEKFGPKVDAEIQESLKAYPDVYWGSYRMQPRKKAGREERRFWFERAKAYGAALGFHHLTSRYDGTNATFTGYDLAFGQTDGHDLSALFTFEVIPLIQVPDPKSVNGYRTIKFARRILNIQYGHWSSKKKVDLAVLESRSMRSRTRVETNGAQEALREWIVDSDASLPMRAHATGVDKNHRLHGVDSVFFELENGAWIIPSTPDGRVDEPIQRWIDECLSYDPAKHTGDLLIASWLARAEARATLGSAFAPDIREILKAFRPAA